MLTFTYHALPLSLYLSIFFFFSAFSINSMFHNHFSSSQIHVSRKAVSFCYHISVDL